jgi:two-component system OmpR family sensor kinase
MNMLTRWNDLPLRLRLTVLYVGLLLILLVALGSFLYFDTRAFLISATAFRLEAQANTAINHLTPPGPPRSTGSQPTSGTREPSTSTGTLATPPFEMIAENLARDLTWQDTVAIVTDKTGARIADGRQSSDLRTIPTPDSSAFARTMAGEPVTYVAMISGQDTLAVLIPIHFPNPDSAIAGVIQMSIPLDIIDQVMKRQGWVIFIGVSLALLIAVVGGLGLTQTALTPLRLMIDVCRRIAAGDLSQRVNLPQRKDETGQLAAAFNEMVERLDNAFATQRQFVADASHELRTPLTAISGSLEVLLLAPEGDPETTRRVLHGMRREVQRLTRLVTDLLILTRLDARRPLKLQAINLTALAREVVENIKSLTKNRAIVVETDGDVKYSGDADQLKQVFYNLLDNAIHSTDAEKGRIILHVQGQARTVQVAVSDNGSGILESAQPHIFERFYRVDKARARATGGSGLGLAIVQAIVEGHGGSIEPVESVVGQGTTIRFTLPRGRGDTNRLV